MLMDHEREFQRRRGFAAVEEGSDCVAQDLVLLLSWVLACYNVHLGLRRGVLDGSCESEQR